MGKWRIVLNSIPDAVLLFDAVQNAPSVLQGSYVQFKLLLLQ